MFQKKDLCPTTTNLTKDQNGKAETMIWQMGTNQKMQAMTECKQPCVKLTAKVKTKYYAKARNSLICIVII